MRKTLTRIAVAAAVACACAGAAEAATIQGNNSALTSLGVYGPGSWVITASGLLFIAGTQDKKFRAYDKSSGELLWETTLPAAGFATPSTYVVNGRQYIVVACGGTKLGAAKSDSYVAFALKE